MIEVYESPDELAQAAAEAGISMKAICERAGIARTTWYRWQKGLTTPTHNVRIKMGSALADLADNRI